MSERIIWSIGGDAPRRQILDTYENPNRLGHVVWRVAEDDGAQTWPGFHPSEADPEGGYRRHPYTVHFALDDEPCGIYRLRVSYLVIAPRVADLALEINGASGVAYLRPRPSRSAEIGLHAGLHAALSAEGEVEVWIPAVVLRRGENRLTLTARDGGEVLRVERREAIKRLDRVANGAGFVYRSLSFAHLTPPPVDAPATVELRPSVIYTTGADGRLRERCDLYLELARPIATGRLTLELTGEAGTERVEIALPATAFGHLQIPFALSDGQGAVAYRLWGALDGVSVDWRGEFHRRRKWTVYVAPHVHTDVGYTHRQWEAGERLCRTVDAALTLLDAAAAPEAAVSFAYHVDATWALERYRETRDERQWRRLVEQIRAGRFGVPGLYVDPLTHLAALEDLIRNAQLGLDLLRDEGLESDFATIVDVASLTSALPAILAGSGIRYLVHANNQDRGPFRLLGGLHRRSPYYWEGITGGRVLVWLSRMYCELRKVCGSPPVACAAARGLDLWLEEYERADYAPDVVLLYGQEADNTDLDPQPAAFLHAWNREVAYPRLLPSAVGDFFREVETRFGATFATVRGDGGAYWEDGAGSTLAATARLRHAQATLPAAEILESLAVIHGEGLAYPTASFAEAWRQVLLGDEHTWGAFLSGSDPDALLARDQWTTKERMIDAAAAWADRLLHVAATRHGLSWNADGREVVVYNPHSWSLGGAVTVEIGRDERVVDATTGTEIPTRTLRVTASQAIVECWVEDLPGLSYRRFRLQPGVRREPPTAGPQIDGPVVLENDYYRLVIAPERGRVTSWYDRALGRDLVDATDHWGFGQLIHARGGEGTRLVSNRADLPAGDPELSGDFALLACRVERWSFGASVRLEGRVPHGRLTIEWTLPTRAKRVEVRYTYDKEERTAKEAVYVAFPLALPDARVASDAQLGWVEWATDALPGACKEWLPLQTGILASAEGAAVQICSPEIPLFCVGDVVRGRWPAVHDLRGGRLFSYVLNNYWHTNYRAVQGGPLTFSYTLTSDAAISPAAAGRLGRQARRPLYAQRLSYQDFRQSRAPYIVATGGTLAELAGDGVILSTIMPARRQAGWVARVQEIGGREAVATLRLPGRPIERAWLTDLSEREIQELPVAPDSSLPIPVPAWGVATARFTLAPSGG